MLVLHTSDLHLGHQLYGYDRTEEQARMLRQIAEVCALRHPDIMLVSGDVFNTSQPSAGVQRMLCDFLTELHDTFPDMPIILTAGNHDSGKLHEIFKSAWSRLNIHVIGTVRRDDDIDRLILGFEKCVVAAVPYFAERFMPDGFYESVVARALETAGDRPVILMAHTSVAGCDFTGHENTEGSYIGGVNSISTEELGSGFDYCALGHIHRPQTFGKEKNVRYSGTPLAVGFDESYPHSVSLVEVEKGESPKVEEIILDPFRPLVTLPDSGALPAEDVFRLFRDFDSESEAYIRLNVEVEGMLDSEIPIVAREIASMKKCRYCLVNPVRKSSDKQDSAEQRVMNVEEFRREDPMSLAERYARDVNEPFDEEMRGLLREVIDRLDDN